MTAPNFFVPTSATSQSVPRGGTPPLSRNSSSGSYSKRSSVVPFTRPGTRTSTDDGTGSYSEAGSHSQPGTPSGFRARRQASGQGLPRSLEEYSFSQSPGRRRSDSDGRSARGRSTPPVAREEGFHVTPALDGRGRHASRTALASEGSPSGSGLLSKAFSGSLATGSPPPSKDVLKVLLVRSFSQGWPCCINTSCSDIVLLYLCLRACRCSGAFLTLALDL